MSNCCDKGIIVDAECCFDSGKFFMGRLPSCLPALSTIRFTAPADYTAGDVVVVKGKELPVRTPGMTAAASDLFKAGAVIHCDIDLDRELAFFWQGGGNGAAPGILPNLSYEEQFAGFYDEEGRKVYFKTVKLGPIPSRNAQFPHGIDGLYEAIDIKIRWGLKYGEPEMVEWFGNVTHSVFHTFAVHKTTISFNTNNTAVAAYTGLATIYYTCVNR